MSDIDSWQKIELREECKPGKKERVPSSVKKYVGDFFHSAGVNFDKRERGGSIVGACVPE